MLVSMRWIAEYVDLTGLDPEALIDRFTLSTAEVEELQYKGKDMHGVIAAEILSAAPHPDSKKLRLLQVDTGQGIVPCVCGAPNAAAGLRVAFAVPGAVVGGQTMREATVGGYPSAGMCCSEAELGVGPDSGGLWVLDPDIPIGTDLKSVLPIDDLLFEVDNKSLTNRPDLWGHYGIAREFSALTGRPLAPVPSVALDAYASLPAVEIVPETTGLLYRYAAVRADHIRRKTAPAAVRIRLFYCGMRPINLLTDLTNYVMLELGQPLHAFDRRRVDAIEVQCFDHAFDFQTLDGVTRRVEPDMLMICSRGEPVAIAGVMGGIASQIEDDTDSVLLEAANFNGESVRKTSTRLGLRTDASMRYEKVLDPEMVPLAAGRFLQLLLCAEPAAVVTSAVSDQYVKRYAPVSISFDKSYIDRYTGIDIPADQIAATLCALGFTLRRAGDAFEADVPTWRATKDVTIPADIVEEITRIYGYDNFDIQTAKSDLSPVLYPVNKSDDYAVKDLLTGKYNLHEIHTYLWRDARRFRALGLCTEDNVRLANAMNPDHTVLRRSLAPSLLAAAADNHLYAPQFGLYEIAKVIDGVGADGMCVERKRLGIVLFDRAGDERALYLHLRDILAVLGCDIKRRQFRFDNAPETIAHGHPRNTALVFADGAPIGHFAVLHPGIRDRIDKKAAVVFAELDMDAFHALDAAPLRYHAPSRYPDIAVDLTFAVPSGVRYDTLSAAWAGDCPFLRAVSLVGVYDADEASAVTVRFLFSSDERTLQRAEVSAVTDGIIARLAGRGIHVKA